MPTDAKRIEASQLSAHSTDFGLISGTDHGGDGDTISACDDDPLLGQTVGGVVIEAVLAEGGMGRVYRGKQTLPPRPVAVKFMRHAARTALTERFHREIEVLGNLVHPNIAQVYTAGEFRLGLQPLPYFVMEFIPDAKTIVRYSTIHKLSTDERLTLFLDACDAIAAGHQQGIVHRDVKPGNILVADPPKPPQLKGSDEAAAEHEAARAKHRVKVIDFGIAKALDSSGSDSHTFTETGEFLGTRLYMSPEQFDGHPAEIDARTDVYSLGVVLQQLLTGKPPHDLTNCSLVEAARIVQEVPPARIMLETSRGDRRLVKRLQAVIHRCLEKRPADRYPNAAALAADVRRVRAGQTPLAAGHSSSHHRVARPLLVLTSAAAFLALFTLAFSENSSRPPTRPTTETQATDGSESRAPPSIAGGFTMNVSSGRTTPVEWVQLGFSQSLASPLTLDNFVMKRNGEPIDLEGVELTPVPSGGSAWVLKNLGLKNAQEGVYELHLVETPDGDRFQGSKSLKWKMPAFKTFRFNLQDDSWDDHVVSMDGVEWYRETTANIPNIFIRPTAIGEEGTIVMKFPVDFPIRAASLSASVSVWTTGDPFPYDPGAWAFLEVSPDGENWTNLITRGPNQNTLQRPPFDILPIVEDSQEVWVRARLTGTKEWPDDGITFSQFLRTEVGDPSIKFQLDLTGRHQPVIPGSKDVTNPDSAVTSGP